jgi:hypothetical protein
MYEASPFHTIHTDFRLLFCGKWTVVDLGDHLVARACFSVCIFEDFFNGPCVNMTFEQVKDVQQMLRGVVISFYCAQ